MSISKLSLGIACIAAPLAGLVMMLSPLAANAGTEPGGGLVSHTIIIASGDKMKEHDRRHDHDKHKSKKMCKVKKSCTKLPSGIIGCTVIRSCPPSV